MGSMNEAPAQRPKSPGQVVDRPGAWIKPRYLTPRRVAGVTETLGLAASPSPHRHSSIGAENTATATKKNDGETRNEERSKKAKEKGLYPARVIEADNDLTLVRMRPLRQVSHSGDNSREMPTKKKKNRHAKKKTDATRHYSEHVGAHSRPQSQEVKYERDSSLERPLPFHKESKAKVTPIKSNDDAVPGSEQIRSVQQSPTIKAEQGSTTVALRPQYRDRAKATSIKKKGGADDKSRLLSDQVRSLEKQEEHQRSQRKHLAAANRRLSKELDQLKVDHSEALRNLDNLGSVNLSLHSIRSEASKRLGNAAQELQVERDRANRLDDHLQIERKRALRLASHVEAEKARLKVSEYELRKFRTALATAFKLLPSLEDHVSLRELMERTECHLREKMAREDARKGVESARGLKSKLAALGGDDEDDDEDVKPEDVKPEDVKPSLQALAYAGPDTGITETRLGTAQPLQASAGQDKGVKREHQYNAYEVWSEDEFDVPHGKRRRSVR